MTLIRLIGLQKRADYLKETTRRLREDVYHNSQDLIVDFNVQNRAEFQKQRQKFQSRRVRNQMAQLKSAYEELNLVYQEIQSLKDTKTVAVLKHVNKFGFYYIVGLMAIAVYLI